MALPAAYTDVSEYFGAAVSFLREYAWVYNEANTCYLKARTLDRMSEQFKDYFLQITNEQLNQFPFVHEPLVAAEPPMPDEVSAFRQKLAELTPLLAYSTHMPAAGLDKGEDKDKGKEEETRSKAATHKVSLKKQHEVSELAARIHAYCQDTPLLVDFGAGLGYLSAALYERNAEHLVLGLEADERRVQMARKRCHEHLPPAAAKSLSYQRQHVGEDSAEYIMRAAQTLAACHGLSPMPLMSIIGLHACADLSISSIKLFLSMPQVRRLVIMPCCYHKLKLTETAATGFVNFPLSAALKSAVAAAAAAGGGRGGGGACGTAASYFNRPFLRLACQQTAARWRLMSEAEHLTHSWHMYVRALAEAVIDSDADELVVKLKGRQMPPMPPPAALKAALPVTFANLRQTFGLHSKTPSPVPVSVSMSSPTLLLWRREHEERFNQINGKYKGTLGLQLTEALTCLQTAMQKLCENLLLYDRLCFMSEAARAQQQNLSVCYEKILDEKLSPRCYVLMAEKLS